MGKLSSVTTQSTRSGQYKVLKKSQDNVADPLLHLFLDPITTFIRSFAQHSLEVIEGHGLDVPIYLIYPIYILQCPVTLNS